MRVFLLNWIGHRNNMSFLHFLGFGLSNLYFKMIQMCLDDIGHKNSKSFLIGILDKFFTSGGYRL